MDIFVGRCGIGVLEKGVRFAKKSLKASTVFMYLCLYVAYIK